MIAQDIEPMAAICREISCVRSNAITVDIDDVVHSFDVEMDRVLTFVGIPQPPRSKLITEMAALQERALSGPSGHSTTGRRSKVSLRELLLNDMDVSVRLSELRRDVSCHRMQGN